MPAAATAPSNSLDSSVCILVPVGPGDRELDRVADLLDSVTAWEPRVTSAVLVDDVLQSRDLPLRLARPGLKIHAFVHPRRGQGSGIWGGLTEGVITALGFIHRNLSEKIVVRLDGDSLVIAPFAERLARRFAGSPEVGLLGTVDRQCNGEVRHSVPWHRIVEHLTHRVGRPRGDETGNFWGGKYLQTVFGGGRRVRSRIEAAVRAGYKPGEHGQGGGYAVRREVLDRMSSLGCFGDASAFRPLFFSEDVAVGMYVRLAGHRLANYNAEGEVFGVTYRGLPYPAPEMIRRGSGVIHSLKLGEWSEERLREYYKEQRERTLGGLSQERVRQLWPAGAVVPPPGAA